jgi:hypothetical protein
MTNSINIEVQININILNSKKKTDVFMIWALKATLTNMFSGSNCTDMILYEINLNELVLMNTLSFET